MSTDETNNDGQQQRSSFPCVRFTGTDVTPELVSNTGENIHETITNGRMVEKNVDADRKILERYRASNHGQNGGLGCISGFDGADQRQFTVIYNDQGGAERTIEATWVYRTTSNAGGQRQQRQQHQQQSDRAALLSTSAAAAGSIVAISDGFSATSAALLSSSNGSEPLLWKKRSRVDDDNGGNQSDDDDERWAKSERNRRFQIELEERILKIGSYSEDELRHSFDRLDNIFFNTPAIVRGVLNVRQDMQYLGLSDLSRKCFLYDDVWETNRDCLPLSDSIEILKEVFRYVSPSPTYVMNAIKATFDRSRNRNENVFGLGCMGRTNAADLILGALAKMCILSCRIFEEGDKENFEPGTLLTDIEVRTKRLWFIKNLKIENREELKFLKRLSKGGSFSKPGEEFCSDLLPTVFVTFPGYVLFDPSKAEWIEKEEKTDNMFGYGTMLFGQFSWDCPSFDLGGKTIHPGVFFYFLSNMDLLDRLRDDDDDHHKIGCSSLDKYRRRPLFSDFSPLKNFDATSTNGSRENGDVDSSLSPSTVEAEGVSDGGGGGVPPGSLEHRIGKKKKGGKIVKANSLELLRRRLNFD